MSVSYQETDQQAFRERVLLSLGRLEALAESHQQQLSKVNGSIVRHAELIEGLRCDLQNHQLECPVKHDVDMLKGWQAVSKERWAERMKELETVKLLRVDLDLLRRDNIEDRTRRQVSLRWMDTLRPALTFLLGIFVALILLHTKELEKWLKL